MKYIRTKDGIYDTTKMSCQTLNDKNGLIMILSYQKQISENCIKVINYKDIIKQANTIEELCDEFVIIPIDQNKKPITHFIRHINESINQFINDSHIIYGAIWTDKGLIYVAKMNEKGELELL